MRADAELAMLLRGMAAMKALLAIAAFAAVYWRFGAPISLSLGVVYAASTAMMAAGAALIWGLSQIGFTAIAFHAALIALAFAALRDGRIAMLTKKNGAPGKGAP
jgi:phosphate/sulfate permease